MTTVEPLKYSAVTLNYLKKASIETRLCPGKQKAKAMASQIPSGNTSLRPVNNGGTKPQTTTQTGTNKPASDQGIKQATLGAIGAHLLINQSGSMALPTDDHHTLRKTLIILTR